MATFQAFEDALHSAVANTDGAVQVDLSEVSFMDSEGSTGARHERNV